MEEIRDLLKIIHHRGHRDHRGREIPFLFLCDLCGELIFIQLGLAAVLAALDLKDQSLRLIWKVFAKS